VASKAGGATSDQLQHLAARFAKVRWQVKRSADENGERDTAALLHERLAGRRYRQGRKELAALKDLVERRLVDIALMVLER